MRDWLSEPLTWFLLMFGILVVIAGVMAARGETSCENRQCRTPGFVPKLIQGDCVCVERLD